MDGLTILKSYDTRVFVQLLDKGPVPDAPIRLYLDADRVPYDGLAPFAPRVRPFDLRDPLLEVPGRLHRLDDTTSSRSGIVVPLVQTVDPYPAHGKKYLRKEVGDAL